MDEHRSALSILERALACGLGAGPKAVAPPIDPSALELALAHVATCAECGRSVDLAETLALMEGGHETPAMTSTLVDPGALFESALTAALADPDELVRFRAAERLGNMTGPEATATGLGSVAIEALAFTSAQDRSQRVRAAALTALQNLDRKVTLPPWLIDLWSERPAEAAPYLEDVKTRLIAKTRA